MKDKKDRIYSELENEVRSLGRKKLTETDFLVWDEKKDGIRFESTKVSKTDNSRNYAVKSLEKRSYRPLQDGEDLEEYLSEFEDTESVCIVDLGNGLEIWDGKEYWSEIEGYNGKYSISTLGRIRNNERDRLLSQSERNKGRGYLCVTLFSSEGKQKTFNVHTLVANAFLPNPQNLPVINHKDENKKNNRVDNLEFCSAQYNVDYSKSREVNQIDPKTGELLEVFKSTAEAARQLGIDKGNIAACCNGRYKTAGGYVWRYTGKGRAGGNLGKKHRQVEVFNPKTGEVIGTFKNQTKTAEFLGVSNVAVKRCLDGITKTCGGYGVRYKDED